MKLQLRPKTPSLETLNITLRPANGTARVGDTKDITLEPVTDRPYTFKVTGSGSITQSGLLTINEGAKVGDVIEVSISGEGIKSTTSKITVIQ